MVYKENNEDTDLGQLADFGYKRSPSLTRIESVPAGLPKLRQIFLTSTSRQTRTLRSHPHIVLVSLFIFGVLCSSGIAISVIFANSYDEEKKDQALELSVETGRWFSSQLDQAILPLFSMAQFVNELGIFRDLSKKIGPAREPGSLPFIPPTSVESGETHRNVTSVCDDPQLLQRFNKIAATIKRNARMEGVLVNVQLAPAGVVCVAHPLNNTEDFPPGIFMDSSVIIGHDILTDPQRKFIAEATIPSDDVVIAGPLQIKQCQDCNPIVEKAFIARLAIEMDDFKIEVDGKVYNKWGFAVVVLNWKALVDRSEVYQTFEREGMQFQLTRTDKIKDYETNGVREKVVVLAESPKFADMEHGHHAVSTDLQTTNNLWNMTVVYNHGQTQWKKWGIVLSCLLSVGISIMVYTILIQKQIHSDKIGERSEMLIEQAKLAAQREREMNDFIAHEIRNPLSAAISATSFVNSSLNKISHLMDRKDLTALQEDVGIIDHSLQFVNALLRNMLDMQRANVQQLKLENVAVDLFEDILQPVASMLYSRYTNFEVIVDCPKGVVVLIDGLRLKQVILNLGRNATKFVERGFIRFRGEIVKGKVRISVEDSGPGIPLEKREKLFCKFQDSLDSLSQGTGLGLNLCKQLVSLMDGEIWMDETYISGVEGCPGARINIDLPVKPIPLSLVLPKHSSDRSIEGNQVQQKELPEELNVLFVDDSLVLRKLFGRTLQKICPKWSVDEAANGESAIKMAETCKYDLIFLDQYMTSTEKQLLGTETARELRSKGVKAIICGLSANDLMSSFLDAGADHFLMKPLPSKKEELTMELLSLLERYESSENMGVQLPNQN